MKLAKLILFLIIVAHLTALSFYGCAIIEMKYDYERTWAHVAELPSQSWIIQYIHR